MKVNGRPRGGSSEMGDGGGMERGERGQGTTATTEVEGAVSGKKKYGRREMSDGW